MLDIHLRTRSEGVMMCPHEFREELEDIVAVSHSEIVSFPCLQVGQTNFGEEALNFINVVIDHQCDSCSFVAVNIRDG